MLQVYFKIIKPDTETDGCFANRTQHSSWYLVEFQLKRRRGGEGGCQWGVLRVRELCEGSMVSSGLSVYSVASLDVSSQVSRQVQRSDSIFNAHWPVRKADWPASRVEALEVLKQREWRWGMRFCLGVVFMVGLGRVKERGEMVPKPLHSAGDWGLG